MKRDTSSKARGFEVLEPGIYRRRSADPTKKGRLMARYTDVYGKQRWVSAKTKSELERKLLLAKAAKENGESSHVSRSVRLFVYAEHWMKTYQGRNDGGMEGSTMRNHKQRLNAHILPQLGKVMCKAINDQHVRDFKQYLMDYRKSDGTPLAQASMASIMKTLYILLRSAYRENYIPSDPTARVSGTIGTKTKVVRDWDGKPVVRKDVLTYDELKLAISTHEDGSWQQLLVRILATTGMRGGELAALTYRDVVMTPSGAYIQIDKAWSDEMHAGKDPKNATSNRRVPIGERLYNDIAAHQEQAKWNDDGDFLFPQVRNRAKPAGRSHVSRVVFGTVNEVITKHVTARLLRHTFITHRVNEGLADPSTGWDLGRVSNVVGHANTRITLEVYMGAGTTDRPTDIDL